MSRDDDMAAGVPMPDYAVLNEPARPVEDREPVGPYAPTRTGVPLSLAESAVLSALSDLIVNQSNRLNTGLASLGNRFDGLVDVVIGLGRQMTDNRVWESERFDRIDTALTKLTDLFVDSRDEIERTMTRPEYLRWTEGFDFGIKGFAEEMATARRETREAFERGRQQGDTDRAREGEDKLIEARAIARAAVEAELLDQGWTPPGATSVDARLLEIVNSDVDGPTDYEVWRDALTLSATNVFPIGGTGEAGTFDDDRRAQILADAEFFRDHLINYPTISPAEADQAIEDQIDAITEHEAAADLPAKETPGAEAEYPF